jgi:hypothetical protein
MSAADWPPLDASTELLTAVLDVLVEHELAIIASEGAALDALDALGAPPVTELVMVEFGPTRLAIRAELLRRGVASEAVPGLVWVRPDAG